MTLVLHRNVMGEEVAPAETLDRRRRRLSTVVRNRARTGVPHIVSVHRLGETALAPTDDTVILKREQRHKLVASADIVVITYLPRGGAGGAGGGAKGGKSILMSVASIALLVVAPYIAGAVAPFLGLGAFGTKMLTMGIVLGGMALLGLANKPKANKEEPEKKVYGVSGGGNLPRPGDRIPKGYGRFWTEPDLSQPDYFIYEGEDQILFKRMTLGLGEYRVQTIRVENTIMWTEAQGVTQPFNGTEVEFIQPGQPSRLVPGDVISSASVQNQQLPTPPSIPKPGEGPPPQGLPEWSGPFVITGTGVDFDKIQIDVSFPNGIMSTFTNKDGAKEGPTVYGYEFQYAPVDQAGNFTGPFVTLVRVVAMRFSRRAVRFTHIIPVAKGRYAVRGKSLYNQDPPFERVTGIQNQCYWDGLRAHRPDVRVRPYVTEIAIRVRSNSALGITSFSDVQVQATSIIPVWNGTAWVKQANRKAVWAFADAMMNPDYGGNIPSHQIDVGTLGYYSASLPQFDTFDGVIRGPDDLWSVASTILLPMRAEPIQLGRIWSLVRDEPKATRRHLISARQIVTNTTAHSFNVEPDTGVGHVIVEYDEDADPKRPIEPPDIIYGQPSITPQRRRLFGVSSYEHAVHIGRWLAASGFFRRQNVRGDTEFDGRIYKRGDSASIETWFAGRSVRAGVLDYDDITATIDLDSDVTVKDEDWLSVRDRRGRLWGPVKLIGNAGGDLRKIVVDATSRAQVEQVHGTLTSALARGVDEEDPTAIIGEITFLTRNYLIKQARPVGTDRMQIEAVIDAPEVWAAVNEAIPSNPWLPETGPTAPNIPVIPWIRGNAIEAQSSLEVQWSVGAALGAVEYQIEISYDAGESWQEIYRGDKLSGTHAIAVNEDLIQIRGRARGENQIWGIYTYSSFQTFRPRNYAELNIEFEDLVEQLKYEIGLISERGEGSLTEARENLQAQIDRLGQAQATIAGHSYEQRRLIKLLYDQGPNLDPVWAAIEQETRLRVAADEATAFYATNLVASLEHQITGPDGVNAKLTAQAAAIDAIETTVEVVAGGLTALSNRVAFLESNIGDATASALNQLSTRVALVEGQYTVQAEQLLVLSTSVGENDATLTQISQSLNGTQLKFGVVGEINGVTGGFLFTGVQRLDGSVAYNLEIMGDVLVSGTIRARHLAVETLITASAQIGTAVIDTAQIKNLSVDTIKIKGGALTSHAYAEGVGAFTTLGGVGRWALSVPIQSRGSDSRFLIIAQSYGFIGDAPQGGNVGGTADPNTLSVMLGDTVLSGATEVGIPIDGGSLGGFYSGLVVVYSVAGLGAGNHTFRAALPGTHPNRNMKIAVTEFAK